MALAAPPEGEKPDPGLDATVMHSRVKLTNEYIGRNFDVSKNTTKLNLVYAFGKPERRDWNIQLDLPVVAYRAGTLPGPDDATGFGDIEMRFGHVVDAEGLFRWGFGLELHFNTAVEPQLGDGVFRVSPGLAFAIQPWKTFKFQTTAQFDQSLSREAGVPEEQEFKLKPAMHFDLPASFYAYFESELAWNIHADSDFSAKLKCELGRGFGARKEWVVSIRWETPLTESADQYTITAGIAYVFP